MAGRVSDWISQTRRYPGRALISIGLLTAVVATPVIFDAALYDDFTLLKQSSLLVAAAIIVFGLALEGRALPQNKIVRVALGAWALCLTLSFVFGIDPLGSVLGVYQYRQGLLTQISYLVLFLGARNAATWMPPRTILLGGAAALAGVFAYTLIQSTGNDPINWWIDTSVRAIGTIGNANELAAYAVVALAFCGAGHRFEWRWRTAVTITVASAASFVLFESESRSGLLAFGIAVAAFPVAAMASGASRRAALVDMGALVAGCLLGLFLSFAPGGASGTAGRVQASLQHAETGNSTRMQLWRGTLSTIVASPLTGFGPDGLYLAFPVHRPADLHGAFDDYDLTAQSSHNWLLDTAANTGIPGLVALLALVGSVAIVSLRHERRIGDGTAAYVWSAMAGYAALTLVNPLSLPAHATFFVLLGILTGRAEVAVAVAGSDPVLRRVSRLALASPVCAALLACAVLLPIADKRADTAWAAYASGDFERAANASHTAARLMPIERAYLRGEASSWLAAGVYEDANDLGKARTAFERMDSWFGLSSGDAIGLATAQIGLGEPQASIMPTVERAGALSPRSIATRTYVPRLRQAALVGGTLHFAPRDRWVFVTVNSEVDAR